MKTRMIFLIALLFVVGCTVGPMKNHYFDKEGNLERTEEGGWISFNMMQTKDDYNSVYIGKIVGGDFEIPIPGTEGFSAFKCAFGYGNYQRLLLHKDAVIVLDVNLDIFKKGAGLTDTMLYGEKAVSGYKEFLVLPDEEETDSTTEDSQ